MTPPILAFRRLRHPHVAIVTMASELPRFPRAHQVPSHSMTWAFLPHPLLSQARGGIRSIVGPRAKAYSTCLPTRTSHHPDLAESFSTRMFKLYLGLSIPPTQAPRCYHQLSRRPFALFLHLKGIQLLPSTVPCRRRSSRSVKALRRLLVILRVLCSKTRLVRKCCRTHSFSEEGSFVCLSNSREDVGGNFVVHPLGSHLIFVDQLLRILFFIDVSCFYSPRLRRLSLLVSICSCSLYPAPALSPQHTNLAPLKKYYTRIINILNQHLILNQILYHNPGTTRL